MRVVKEHTGSLIRRLGFFPVYNIVVANMIGAGIFTTSGLLMENLGNAALMILLWAGGGILALCGALSYGELGAAMPRAGGEYIFLSRLYMPSLGFLSGWVSFIAGFSAPIAASAIGFSEYFLLAFPALSGPTGICGGMPPGMLKKLLATVVILLFVFIHARGMSFGSRVQNLLTILKIVLILGLTGIGLFWGKGDWGNFSVSSAGIAAGSSWESTGLSLVWIMFAYSGWNAATYIGSEVKNPGRNIPLALVLGTLSVLAIYLVLNLFFVYAVPPDEMKGVISVAGLAATRAFSEETGFVISLLISFALFSSLSAYLIIGPRVYFAMAGDGLFFKSLAKVSPETGAPARAIYLQGLLSVAMVLSGTFDQILTYMGFALGIFPILAVAGIFKLRKSEPGRKRLPGYPVVQIIFLSASLTMLILAFTQRPVESLVAIATVLTGWPVFWFFKRKTKDKNSG